VFTTEIDQSQNLLVVRYGGRVTPNKTSQCLKEMGTALRHGDQSCSRSQADIGLQIMSYFHYGSGVRIATCETLAQAINMLSEENAS
jgi:hypothetical protein